MGGFLVDVIDYIFANNSANSREVPIYGEEWLEKRGQTIDQAKSEIPTLQTFCKGTGEEFLDWTQLEQSIFGIDVSRQMVRIATINLMLHGIRHPKTATR